MERNARNAEPAVPAADAAERRSEDALDESRSIGSAECEADERSGIRKTGWEPEREIFFRLQRTEQQRSWGYDYDSGRCEEAAFGYDTESSKENPPLRMGLDYSGDLVRGVVRLGRAVEQMTDNVPVHDGTTMPAYIDSKRQRKVRQKKTALGHAEDDHDDWDMKQEL